MSLKSLSRNLASRIFQSINLCLQFFSRNPFSTSSLTALTIDLFLYKIFLIRPSSLASFQIFLLAIFSFFFSLLSLSSEKQFSRLFLSLPASTLLHWIINKRLCPSCYGHIPLPFRYFILHSFHSEIGLDFYLHSANFKRVRQDIFWPKHVAIQSGIFYEYIFASLRERLGDKFIVVNKPFKVVSSVINSKECIYKNVM